MKISKQELLTPRRKTRPERLRRNALLGLVAFLLVTTAAWGQTIYVNRWYSGILPSDGTPTRPFRYLTAAYDAARDGWTIQIAAGDYPELLTLTKRLTLVANGGPVIIGSSSLDVLTQRNGPERTGAYRYPGLNSATVLSPRWGLVGSLPVDGSVYAQPLYVERLRMPDGYLHNVIFIATHKNNLYAFDADTYAPLWNPNPLSLGPYDLSPTPPDSPPDLDCTGFSFGEGVGIMATPVIDRTAGRMYVSYRTNPSMTNPSSARQKLAVVDIRTGRVLTGEDRELSFPGYPDWHLWHMNRAGLLLLNGVVYVGFNIRCEGPGFTTLAHGTIMAFNARPLNQVGIYTTTPGDTRTGIDGGGIWQASTGLAADAEGNIYFMTGNRRLLGRRGPYDTSPPDQDNLADSLIRLQPVITRDAQGVVTRVVLTVADRFTPYRKIWLDDMDMDLGSAGVVLIPGTNYLMGGGKQGILYVLDRRNLGGFDQTPDSAGHKWDWAFWEPRRHGLRASDLPEDFNKDRVRQKFQVGFNQYIPPDPPLLMDDWIRWPHIHGTPVFATFRSGRALMYVWPEKDHLKAFPWLGDSFDLAIEHRLLAVDRSGALVLAPPFRVGIIGATGMPGGMLSVSIDPNQSEGGVLFASINRDRDPPAYGPQDQGWLRAFDAVTLRELWNNDSDRGYLFAKFVPPTIAGGKVFLPTKAPDRAPGKVLVYGQR